MIRLVALLTALAFGLAAFAPPVALAQAKKDAPAKSETKSSERKAAEKEKAPIDINTASEKELDALPGIGEAYAKKIVENRPYKRKDELVRRKVIPQATYDTIKDQIIAKQPPKK